MVGPVEAGTQVVVGFMESLKREPLSLALVVMNLSLLGFFWLILNVVAEQRKHEVDLIYEDKKLVQQLLSKCVVSDKESRTFLIPDIRAPFLPPNRIEF